MSTALFSTCNLCFQPGTFENCADNAVVQCHLKAFSEQKFTVWRCSNCLSLHSLEPVDLDFFYKHYPFRSQKLDAGTRVVYLNRLSLLIRKAGLEKRHSILDFGSGQGLFVEFLKTKGYSNSHAYDPYILANSEERLLKRKYDCVMAQDVLEHVDDPIATIRMLEGCLSDSGVLVLGTPNAEGIDLRRALKFANELHQPYHRHIPSKHALLDVLELHGFSEVTTHDRYYFDTLMPTVNTRFINEYTLQSGGFAEALVEPPNWLLAIQKPHLIAVALTGYFNPSNANMMLFARRKA